MKSDLDGLMLEHNLDAFIIPNTEGENFHRDYLTGGVHASATVIKKHGSGAVLIVSPMEVDEAAKSGLHVMTFNDFDIININKKHGRNTPEARAALWENILAHFEITGRVTFYGAQDMQSAMYLLGFMSDHFKKRLQVVRDAIPDIFDLASATKDADELEKLRDSGIRASKVMRETRAWLSTHRIKDDQIVDGNSKPLTIGAVKQFVRLKLLENEMEDVRGQMIFAQGRDAGVPHSRGEAEMILCPGQSIVFDLFPRPVGGGYFHDMTRTWCLGYAPEEIQRDFETVQDVFFRSLEGITLDEPTKNLDIQVCKWFESAGHATFYSTSDAQEGYIHSLGHGVGLQIHEDPPVSQFASEKVTFKPGHAVTIEPGLYYPSKGYGIRIEDTVFIEESGQVHNLTDCPYDLVIPLKS